MLDIKLDISRILISEVFIVQDKCAQESLKDFCSCKEVRDATVRQLLVLPNLLTSRPSQSVNGSRDMTVV